MKLSPLALAVALLPSIAAALEPYQAPPMVITRGTALEKPAPASTRVIDRNEIERSAASSLIEVLNGKAGIQILSLIHISEPRSATATMRPSACVVSGITR